MQPTFQTPPSFWKGVRKGGGRQGNKRMEKSRRLGTELLGKGGAQPTTVPSSLPAGAKPGETRPGGTAPGLSHAGKAQEGAQGPPWLCMLEPSPARLPSLSHPPLPLQTRGGGWQPAERGGRAGKAGVWQAKLELGRPVRGREPKPPRASPPLATWANAEGRARQARDVPPCSCPGKGLHMGRGGEMRASGWV